MATKEEGSYDQHLGESTTFSEWIRGKGEYTEKVVSVVVLLIEIILLFWHNIPENISFYIFTGLNCFFSFFIYFTYVKKDWNILFVLNKKFRLKLNYTHPEFEFQQFGDSFKAFSTEFKRDPKTFGKHLLERPESFSKLLRDNILRLQQDEKTNDEIWTELFTESPVEESDYYKELLKLAYLEKESESANRLIMQFSIIRYAWFYTGILYIILITTRYLFGGEEHYSALNFLHPWLMGSTVILTLIATYYYLVAYYILYYVTLDYDARSRTFLNKHLHFKKTVWWAGIILFLGIAYIFFSWYYGPNNPELLKSVELDGYHNKILIVGNNAIVPKDSVVIIKDDDEQATYKLVAPCESEKKVNLLDVEIHSSHRKKVTLIDNCHNSFYIHSSTKDSSIAILEIQADRKNSLLKVKTDGNVEKVNVLLRQHHQDGNVVDFVFQCIAGLLAALIMCFFVSRFDSINFKTPNWNK